MVIVAFTVDLDEFQDAGVDNMAEVVNRSEYSQISPGHLNGQLPQSMV